MDQATLDEMLKDCVAYVRHRASVSILDRWDKQEFAHALDAMALRLKIVKGALRSQSDAGEKRG